MIAGARVQVLCPPKASPRSGNRVSAERWRDHLRELGAHVRITHELDAEPTDVLLALHARKTARAVLRFRRREPERPIVVALTGTDIFPGLERSPLALDAVRTADALIALYPGAAERVPRAERGKVHVVYQSVVLPDPMPVPNERHFNVLVLGHLRPVKDPLRAALAVRKLPPESRIRVRHVGEALTPALTTRVREESERNPRYHWFGPTSRTNALKHLGRAHLLVLSSRSEGGANVIGEAATAHVPILASDVHGNRGLLGPDHPGYFPYRNTTTLRTLLLRAETAPAYYAALKRSSQRIAPLFTPTRERRSLDKLFRELLR